jgi:hypothetical protein
MMLRYKKRFLEGIELIKQYLGHYQIKFDKASIVILIGLLKKELINKQGEIL